MRNKDTITVMLEREQSATIQLRGGGIESDHERMNNRHKDNQHPISAITGLKEFAASVDESYGQLENKITELKGSFTTEGIQKNFCNYYSLLIPIGDIKPSFLYANIPFEANIYINGARISDDSEVSVIFEKPNVILELGLIFLEAKNILSSLDESSIVQISFFLVKKPTENITFQLKITGGKIVYD